MWQVIKRNSRTNTETRSKEMQWFDAQKLYQRWAGSINRLKENGEYAKPHIRLSLHKSKAEVTA